MIQQKIEIDVGSNNVFGVHMKIRNEMAEDIPFIYSLNESAFDSDDEAKLVNALRTNVKRVISLVAETNDEVIGHIMFSPVTLIENTDLKFYGLAPMAVGSKFQNQGVGTLLVEAGLRECKSRSVSAVFVLGHPNYYPRFGFKSSSVFGIKSEYEVPEDVFMGIELVPGSLNNLNGVVKYSAEFGSV